MSKRTVQRVIEKLVEKDFIEVATPADIYKRTSTTYWLFPYPAIKDVNKAKGRTHVAKIGCGVSFVRKLDLSTVDNSALSTVARMATLTVAKTDLTTVVPLATLPKGLKSLGYSGEIPSSSVAVVQKALADATGEVVDDDAARQLIAACRNVAADAADDEIAFFATAKARKLRHLGGLLLAVPKCFEPVCLTNHRQRREFERQEREEEAEKWAQVAADSRVQYQRLLDDPETPPEMREIARKLLN